MGCGEAAKTASIQAPQEWRVLTSNLQSAALGGGTAALTTAT